MDSDLKSRIIYAMDSLVPVAIAAELARRLNVEPPSVAGWRKGKGPAKDKLPALAEYLGVDLQWLAYGIGAKPIERFASAYSLLGGLGSVGAGVPQPEGHPMHGGLSLLDSFVHSPLPAPQPSELTQMIPVYGSAQGGNGDGCFELNGHAIDHIRCPPGLAGVKGAYSLRVQGISMEPRYFEGEIVYVNPARSVTPGCFVVIQMKPAYDGDPIKAFIKQLVRRTAEKLVVHQYQPDSDYDIPAGDVLAVHRILNGEDLF